MQSGPPKRKPFVRAYLRASTDEQDAFRSRGTLDAFAAQHDLEVAAYYTENVSGATLARPELFRLLHDARSGDLLLVEQVDRLSRLSEPDWRRLRTELEERHVRVVALDLPTSWAMAVPADDFTSRMFDAVNAMMLDMLAAIARKDYDDRRRRVAEGQARAKAEGRYKGRPEDAARNAGIAGLLRSGESWTAVQDAFGCSRATVAKVAARLRAKAGA